MAGIIHNPSHHPPYIPDCLQSFVLGIVVGVCALAFFCAMYGCGACLAWDGRWNSRGATRRRSMVEEDEEDGPRTPSDRLSKWPSTRETSPEVSPDGSPKSIVHPKGWDDRMVVGC
jgi:hypothetical protein